MVIDLAAAGLYEEDILATDRLLDFNASLANRKFAQEDLGRRYSQVVADSLGELRVAAAAQDDQVAHHFCDGCRIVGLELREVVSGRKWDHERKLVSQR